MTLAALGTVRPAIPMKYSDLAARRTKDAVSSAGVGFPPAQRVTHKDHRIHLTLEQVVTRSSVGDNADILRSDDDDHGNMK